MPRIGRFVLLRRLGAGGMGVVYSAYDEDLDRRVAIELLHDDGEADETSRRRMRREAQALARLSHPNESSSRTHRRGPCEVVIREGR